VSDKPWQFQPGEGGRPKGLPNKTTRKIKEMFAIVADELGGATALLAWVRKDPKNETIFWSQMMTKMLPVQMSGEDGGPLALRIVRDFSGNTGDQVSPEA